MTSGTEIVCQAGGIILEHNTLDRPLLDFRAMTELLILRLFGNPFEFLPEILPLHNLQHLSLANTKIVADENLRPVNMQIEVSMNTSFSSAMPIQ
ncbi:hypothetical protein CCACVL1_09493 [Corchorus capsularis]|uniref:Uncharacterized protein n=1 Tax=Corchorus capsularis TaxID=210143 RepID=A0A1R3IVZ4_COCAP|nr:hypothetical protein CCACVL1_09493 [Corchorus capsularis]